MFVRILAVQHNMTTPPGLIGDRILQRGGTLELVMPRHGGQLPQSPHGYDGLILLGGEMSAADDENFPHYKPLLELVQEFGDRKRPVMGICLGAQLMARAYGAPVRRHSFTEFGYIEHQLTDDGACDPVLAGIENGPWFMQWHEDTFDLPEDAIHLIRGDGCQNQAFRYGTTAYAFQFHLEVTDWIARQWSHYPEAKLASQNGCPVQKIENELKEHYEAARTAAYSITDNWLQLV